jgi:hypothetical protein
LSATDRPLDGRRDLPRWFVSPLVKVALLTAGPLLVLYAGALVVALNAKGLPAWRVFLEGVGATIAAAFLALLGFLATSKRCPRCRLRTELVGDEAGQALCARCWLGILAPLDGSLTKRRPHP